MTDSTNVFCRVDELVHTTTIVVDRPKGSAHPRIDGAVYPLDYGYLEGTVSGDGQGIDVFVGSAPGQGVVGLLVTADPAKRDIEVKVLVDCNPREIEAAEHFASDTLRIGGLLIRRTRP